MKFKEKIKIGVKQIQEALQNLTAVFTHHDAAADRNFQTIISHLEEFEKQTADSIASLTAQINRLDEMIQKESGNKSMPDISPAVQSLSEELRAQQEEILQQLSNIRETIANTPKSEVGTPDLSSQISKIGTSVSRHNMVIEDLIESMEDAQEQQKKTLEQMQKVAAKEESAKIASLRSSEASLLKLAQTYQDQFYLLERAAQEDPSWSRQFSFVRQIVASQLQASGISVIEATEIPVNYEIHEVIDRVSTENPALNQCVAEVFETGYIFNGEVKRKARVSAYLLSSSETAPMSAPSADTVADSVIHLSTDSEQSAFLTPQACKPDADSAENRSEQTDDIPNTSEEISEPASADCNASENVQPAVQAPDDKTSDDA